MNPSTIEAIIAMDERVKAATRHFHNSSCAATVHDPHLGSVFGEMELRIVDLLLAAILSQVHVLATGSTGRGKTALVQLVCQGVFGSDGWHLLRLNPHLSEETFADINMKALKETSLRQAISPAPFLSLPCTVLDECNRTPAALTNILLGFCEGRIELKCGLKSNVGYNWTDTHGQDQRYHLVIGTMNEGGEYKGTFETDLALASRFTLMIPFDALHPTPHDMVEIVEDCLGPPEVVQVGPWETSIDLLAPTSQAVLQLPLEPLASVYLLYLANLGRCVHSRSGWKPSRQVHEVCRKSECRIMKLADGFCPSVGGLNERLVKSLRQGACGLAALRAARTVRAVSKACAAEPEHAEVVDQLRTFAETDARREELRDTVIAKYLRTVSVTAGDVKALLPFVALGGRAHIESEYVAKHFDGSMWLAAQHYALETYASLEGFFRQHYRLVRELMHGNGAVERLKQVLEHAQRFSDPFILPTIDPLLDRAQARVRTPGEISEEIEMAEPIRSAAGQLLNG